MDDHQPLRYTSVKTYNFLDLKKRNHSPSLIAGAPKQQVAEPEKQLFSPTISKVVDAIETEEDISEVAKESCPAKRNIDFLDSVMEDGKQDNAASCIGSSSGASRSTLQMIRLCRVQPRKARSISNNANELAHSF